MQLKLLHFKFKTLFNAKVFALSVMKKIPKWYLFSYRLTPVRNDEDAKYQCILYFNEYEDWQTILDIIFDIAKENNYRKYEKQDY